MKTPLKEITVTCAVCGEVADLDEINADVVRYYNNKNEMVRFPSDGLEYEEIEKLKQMPLLCEMCQEED